MQFSDKVKEILERALESLCAIGELAQKEITLQSIIEKTQSCVNQVGCEFVEAICQQVDDNYAANRSKGVVVNDRQRRKLLTSMGEITLERRQYLDKQQHRYFLAADELLGICRYSRIENGLQAQILSTSAHHSFGVAATAAGCSRQTAFNVVKRNQVEVSDVAKIRRPGQNYIYIEADEDHIHLNNGRSAEVKLVYVHEGRKNAGGNRMELVNARYFASLGEADVLWQQVADYVGTVYGEHVFVQIFGDGANWIKAGVEWFHGSVFRLDKFHTYKNMTTASAGDKKTYWQLKNLLLMHSFASEMELEQFIQQQIYSNIDTNRRNSLIYLLNNYFEIDLSDRSVCSAESHVSHVLSKRMSSRPMGWSVAGAERIARLRCFLYNGGDFGTVVKRHNRMAQEKTAMVRGSSMQNYHVEPYHCPVLDGKLTAATYAVKKVLKS